MQTETYLVTIGVLLLALILRPAPVVLVQRDRNQTSIGWIIGLAFVVASIWLLGRSGCSAALSSENGTDTKKTSGHTPINSPPFRLKKGPTDTIINSAPLKQGPIFLQQKGGNSHPSEDIQDRRELGHLWVVLLKVCQSEEEVLTLSTYFSMRNIEPVKMTNGEYWAVIHAPGNKKGKAESEKRDWMQHQKDWERFAVKPEVIDLNDP